MSRTSTVDRLQRLELITSRLKSDAPTTLGEIAKEFGISTRTLHRDIEILRQKGVPIEADRGRGGGVRLQQNWGAGRIRLDYQEAIDLLISLAISEQMGSPLFLANLAPVRLKLMASFAPAVKNKIRGLKARLLIGESASPAVLAKFSSGRKSVIGNLHQAFLIMRWLRIAYRDEHGTKSCRDIEPHYLLLNYPVWYVLAWDDLRQDVRTFRCDRLESAKILDDGFRLRPLSRFQQALEGVAAVSP